MENTTRCSESVSPIEPSKRFRPALPLNEKMGHCFAVQISLTEDDTAGTVGIMLYLTAPTLSSAHHRPDPGRANAMPMDRGANARSTPRKVAVASCCWPPITHGSRPLWSCHTSPSLSQQLALCVCSRSRGSCVIVSMITLSGHVWSSMITLSLA
jgi:hypothetical protein